MEITTTFMENTSATEAVKQNIKTYIQYSNNEFLPSVVDGLKLLWRRILLVLHDNKKEMQKCTALTGACMETYHPHGDNGVEEGIKCLSQPFKQAHPWLIIKGNFGAYNGEAAAGRYLDVCPSQFTKDIFFDNVDRRTYTYIPSEIGHGAEPLYLIPLLPTVFLFGGRRLAAAFISNTPFFNFTDVCNLVLVYLKLRLKYPHGLHRKHFKAIAKYCLPDFPSHSIIRNRSALLESYERGDFNAPVVMDGIMDLEPNGMHIRSIPYGSIPFDSLLPKLGQKMNSANYISANTNEINDLTNGIEYGDISVKLKRGVNPFEAMERFKTECSFTQRWNPQWMFVDKEGYVVEMNPMELLDVWYNARHRSILAGLKFINNDYFRRYRQLMALVLIADHTDEIVTIFKQAENRDATIPILVKQFGLTREQAEYISTLQLHQLTRQGKDDLLKEMANIKEKIKEHQKKFTQIDNIIITDVERLKKTYSAECPRRTLLPNYLGAIHVLDHSGYLQFTDWPDLARQYRRWNKSLNLQIEFYPIGSTYRQAIGCHEDPEIELPQAFMAKDLVVAKEPPRYTVIYHRGALSYVDGIVDCSKISGQHAYVAGDFLMIKPGYKLEVCNPLGLTKRSSADAAGTRTKVGYLSSIMADKVIVASVDINFQNVVFLRMMSPGDTFPQPLLGASMILGIWEPTTPIYLEIPEYYVTRCSTRKLLITNPTEFMQGKPLVEINFNRKKTNDDRTLGYLHKQVDILSDLNLKGSLE